MIWHVSTFYCFTPLSEPQLEKTLWEQKALELGLLGLVVMGTEGFNTTFAAPDQNQRQAFKDWVLARYPATQGMLFKDSISDKAPFKRFKVKIRPEIVTLATPELVPNELKHQHLTPAQWDETLKNDPTAVVIDTRNWYEYQIGTFEKALNPNIEKFTDFPQWFQDQGINKEQKILIFCTGGIRCEKGIYELERQGYENVYQLEGGIIHYLEQFPRSQFKGECFIFDHRIALDQDLKPTTTFGLCPHCGQPAATHKICKHCDTQYRVCDRCQQLADKADLCSKNCVYHFHLHPHKKGRKQTRTWEKP